jgi:hypothetical protein
MIRSYLAACASALLVVPANTAALAAAERNWRRFNIAASPSFQRRCWVLRTSLSMANRHDLPQFSVLSIQFSVSGCDVIERLKVE